MDSYFSGDLTKEDMLAMKARYDTQLEDLRRRMSEAAQRRTEKTGSTGSGYVIESGGIDPG